MYVWCTWPPPTWPITLVTHMCDLGYGYVHMYMWHIRMWRNVSHTYVSHICICDVRDPDMCHTYVCVMYMTPPCVTHNARYTYVWLTVWVCVTRLAHICDVTLTSRYGCIQMFMWHIHVCDLRYGYIQMCDLCYGCVCRDICMCDMARVRASHNSYVCVSRIVCMYVCVCVCVCVCVYIHVHVHRVYTYILLGVLYSRA